MWEAVCVTLLELGVLGNKTDVPVGCVSISCGTGEGPQLDLASSCVQGPDVHFCTFISSGSAPVAGLRFAPACFLLRDHTKWSFADCCH